VANEDHLRLILTVRQRTRVLVALGDCAVAGNVTALRNLFVRDDVLRAAYVERATAQPQIPAEFRDKGDTGGEGGEGDADIVPRLLPRVEPLHRVVKVDAYLPGCPPSADGIWDAITAALHGELPATANGAPRFG
jgi:NAD-reducing hydrogenase small subunit